MKRWVGWMIDILRGQRHTSTYPRPIVDPMAIRDELTRTDPDFARVREAHHDAIQVLTAKGIRDGLALRREVDFWQRNQSKP